MASTATRAAVAGKLRSVSERIKFLLILSELVRPVRSHRRENVRPIIEGPFVNPMDVDRMGADRMAAASLGPAHRGIIVLA
jgi:hypothetical protein